MGAAAIGLWVVWVGWVVGCVDPPALARGAQRDAGDLWSTDAGERPATGAALAPRDDAGREVHTFEPATDGGERIRAADGGDSAEGQAAREGSGALQQPSGAGAVLFTELMIDPASQSDAEGEWFELFNPGREALQLQGCALADGGAAPHRWSEQVVPAGGFVTVARGSATGFKADLVLSFSLRNDADMLALSCQGVAIDRVAYDDAAGFPVAAGRALSLDPRSFDADANDAAAAWCAATGDYAGGRGTPGRPNPPCAVDDDAGI